MKGVRDRIAGLSPEQRALLEKKLTEASRAKLARKPITHDATQAPVPSFVQQQLWTMEQIEGGTSRFNISITVELDGSLDLEALSAALTGLVARHEPLRSRFCAGAEAAIQLEILPPWEFLLPLVDLTGTDCAGLDATLHDEVNRPFQLNLEPLIRGVLYRREKDRHLLQLIIHHLVTDGWSMGVVLRDLAALYNSAVTRTPAKLPPLKSQFSDYARWQRDLLAGPEADRMFEYWARHVEGSPQTMQLPVDRPRPAQQTYRGASHHYTLSGELASAIDRCCVAENVTPFMVLLAASFAVLARYTGQTDMLVGSPMAARLQMETEEMVGCFTNMVVLRGNLQDDPTMRELLQRVRKTALGAQSHQDLPLGILFDRLNPERDPSQTLLFQVIVIMQNAPQPSPEFTGLKTAVQYVPNDSAKVDLTLELTPRGEGFEADVEYNRDIFDASTIDRLWEHLTGFLRNALADPARRVASIPILSESERRRMLFDWNHTESAYPRETPLAKLIESRVADTPDAVAVTAGDRTLSYSQLNDRANRLARELERFGAAPNQLVAVLLERTVDLVVALLATMKTGAAYLPLDPLLPARRLDDILRDSGVSLLVNEEATQGAAPDFSGKTIRMEDAVWMRNSAANLNVPTSPDDLAYVMYTSGSTGKPKGVEIPQAALTNFLYAMQAMTGLSQGDRALAVTTISFDIAGLEIWLPLLVGAQIVLAGRDDAADGDRLRHLLERHEITLLQATPMTWQALLQAGWQGRQSLLALCGGEAMPPDLAAKLAPRVKHLWNMYGPTETTIWSTSSTMTDASETVPIGRPIANTRCYVLDAHRQPVPVGVTGELYLGGDGLARGYRDRPDLTAQAFFADDFAGGTARMYRTGDLARYRPDGQLECLGRVDTQLKIRGFRIEPGEIETTLKSQPGVADAVVVLREDVPGDKRLVAYLVPAAGCAPDPADVRGQLALTLPHYMVPSDLQMLERLPLSPNGKVDRKALPAPVARQSARSASLDAPRGPVEEILTQIWAEVLGVPRVGIFDDYFAMGGDSLRAVRLILRIRAAFPETRPSLTTLLKAPTVDRFAHTLAAGHAGWSCLVAVREGTARPPFFCVHGAGGNVLSMRDLAMAMPSDLPFYCLQARGLDGLSPPFASVEEAAESYVNDIRKVQPKGPYYLGGGCFGGVVAFAMACRLQSMGETVGVLALMDARNPAYGRLIPKGRLLRINGRYLTRRALHHLGLIRTMNGRDSTQHLSQAGRTGLRLVRNVVRNATGRETIAQPRTAPVQGATQTAAREFEATLRAVRDASLSAARRFVPRRYQGQLTLFRAKQLAEEAYEDDTLGWYPVVSGGITTHQIDSDHIAMFRSPGVSAIAGALDAALREHANPS